MKTILWDILFSFCVPKRLVFTFIVINDAHTGFEIRPSIAIIQFRGSPESKTTRVKHNSANLCNIVKEQRVRSLVVGARVA